MSKKTKKKSEQAKQVLPTESLAATAQKPASTLEKVVSFSPLLVGAFTASAGFSSFRAETFISALGLILTLSFGLEGRVQQRKKLLWSPLLLLAIFFYSVLSVTLKHPHAFYVLVVLFMAVVLFYSIVVTSPRQLLQRSIIRIVMLSSIALLGAITQSEAVIWGVLLLGYLPACFIVAAEIIEYAPMLTEAGWQRTISVEKDGKQQRRPGGLTRLLSLAMVILPGLLLLPIPFAIIPSGFLLLGLLFYPALNIIQDFQDQAQSDSQLRLRALRAALLAALLMPVIAWLSIA